MIDLRKMTTESRNEASMNLDSMTSLEVVTLMNREDAKVPEAIKGHHLILSQRSNRGITWRNY